MDVNGGAWLARQLRDETQIIATWTQRQVIRTLEVLKCTCQAEVK